MTLEHVEFTAIRVKEVGELTDGYTLLTAEEVGIGERSLVSPGITTIRGRDADDNFVELMTVKEPTTDNDTFNIDYFGHYDLVETLTQFKIKEADFFLQLLSFASPPVDTPSLATKVEHYLCKNTGLTLGAGRNRDGSGGPRENSIAIAASNRVIANFGASLSKITNSATEDAMCILMLDRKMDRSTGYSGPDEIIYVGLDDDTSNPGTILVSTNGGGTFAAISTDPDPFATITGINFLAWQPISQTQFRLIAGNEGVAGTKAQFAYGDLTYGGESADPGWTVVSIDATATGDGIEAMLWPMASRFYVASAGDIYLNTDLGVSDPGSAIYTGSNAFAEMFMDKDRNVWAVGASNTILVEWANARGTFVARVGPSGGGAFTTIARADDGVIFAGNGQSLYRNTNRAGTTGGWTSLKDFGSNHVVNKIQCVNGSSEIIRAVVHDGTGNDGDLWYSTDGGLTFTEVTDLSNNGYNDAAFSKVDPNLAYLVGPIDTNPIIQQYA